MTAPKPEHCYAILMQKTLGKCNRDRILGSHKGNALSRAKRGMELYLQLLLYFLMKCVRSNRHASGYGVRVNPGMHATGPIKAGTFWSPGVMAGFSGSSTGIRWATRWNDGSARVMDAMMMSQGQLTFLMRVGRRGGGLEPSGDPVL